ncbi:MAG: PLP-dependent aminotransferase family protein [Hyphomicrobiales bacterium]|nr:PLP-dependent aminotransferase family protein [Hyphomicrobiales bacterium]
MNASNPDWSHRFAGRMDGMHASEIRELLKLLARDDIIAFAGGVPDPALFPTAAFADAFSAVLAGPGGAQALQYSASEGHGPLRAWIAARMGAQGMPCTADNILITNGSQQALDLIGRLFLSAGDTALVQAPSYLGALQAFDAYEPRYDLLPGPGDNRTPAAYTAAAGEAGGSAKFAYVVPDFANPTGETMDLPGREALLDLAEGLDAAVVEDAAYAALRYDGAALPSLLSLDIARHGTIDAARTIHCGTFSKTLAPALRVGWVCAARPLVDKLVLLKQAGDLHSATVNQIALLRVLEGGYDAQVEKVRAAYRARRDAMLAALERHMPASVAWTRPRGGMFVWVTLPPGLDGAALLRRAVAEAGVTFVPGAPFHALGGGANTLRLSYSLATPAQTETGIARLGALVAEMARAA